MIHSFKLLIFCLIQPLMLCLVPAAHVHVLRGPCFGLEHKVMLLFELKFNIISHQIFRYISQVIHYMSQIVCYILNFSNLELL